ncbi:hypothetical protein P3L10_025791 [Capsicum annuum]
MLEFPCYTNSSSCDLFLIHYRCTSKQTGAVAGESINAIDGLVGLRSGNASLISQLVACGTVKKKFAHCLDGVKGGGIFAIGQVVELKVNSVPMIPEQVHYSIPLDHIEVGGQVLNILDFKDESKTIQEGIIDSGITLTWVPRKVYKAIKNKLMERQPHLKFQKDVLAHDCFKYGGKVDDGFPAVTFKFKGNLALAAYPHDYLIEDVI